jgi:hypothetical protein
MDYFRIYLHFYNDTLTDSFNFCKIIALKGAMTTLIANQGNDKWPRCQQTAHDLYTRSTGHGI